MATIPGTTTPAPDDWVQREFANRTTLAQIMAAADRAASAAQGFSVQGSALNRAAAARTGYLNAAAAAQNAVTNQAAGAAAANLDATRARLLPDESRANIGLVNAQAYTTREQGRAVGPESRARIGLMGSEAGLNRANTAVANDSLRTYSISPTSLQNVMGSFYRLPSITPGY